MLLIPRARSGDREAWGRLAWLYEPFIVKVANWYNRRDAGTYDDAYQGGQLGLKSAIDDFKLGQGASFSTFVAGRIRTGAQLEVHHQREGGRARGVQILAWDEPVDLPGEDGRAPAPAAHLADAEPDAEQVCARGRVIARVQEVVQGAVRTPNEKLVAEHRILADEPMTLHELAELIGHSHEHVRHLEHRVMSRVSVVLRHDADRDEWQ